ncbi:hypothetical protein [Methanobrevibacter sp.]|uniref:hypothetical protein n=1 Tax=Methanobrevibacter sp. TaxID=66852 RepID=UPI00386D62E0
MKRTKSVSRTFEMMMGIFGSVIGMFSGSFLIFIKSFGQSHPPFLGVIAILASILGFISVYYVRKNPELAGVGFIIATMFVIVGADYINILSSMFLLVAGVSSLFRK